ncbi:hypothetical protein [Sphaerisporangium corydalis]|uniref:Uncharacterized protein n=1 Tax=Sphaerisporangium corydalis TaxID=1441875 RepID=A0ABV9EC72_9ACTN|nr:hypothetical protein [Sphaerisporangium corydalis]
MIFPGHGNGEIPEEQRHANLETVRRVRRVVADLVEAERRRGRAERLMTSWGLDRDELDEAAGALGIPALRDDEWESIGGRAYEGAAYEGGGHEARPYEGGGHEAHPYEGHVPAGHAREGHADDGRAYEALGCEGRAEASGRPACGGR